MKTVCGYYLIIFCVSESSKSSIDLCISIFMIFSGDLKSRDLDFLDAVSSAVRSVVKHILEAEELHVSVKSVAGNRRE